MIISKITLSEPAYMRRGTDKRCQHKVKSGPPSHNGTCDRFATYNMDGGIYCAQHAGKIALEFLIKGDENGRRYLTN